MSSVFTYSLQRGSNVLCRYLNPLFAHTLRLLNSVEMYCGYRSTSSASCRLPVRLQAPYSRRSANHSTL